MRKTSACFLVALSPPRRKITEYIKPVSVRTLMPARRLDGVCGISSRLSDADTELYVRAKETGGTVWPDDGPQVRLLERKGMPLVHTFAPLLRLLELGAEESQDEENTVLTVSRDFAKCVI